MFIILTYLKRSWHIRTMDISENFFKTAKTMGGGAILALSLAYIMGDIVDAIENNQEPSEMNIGHELVIAFLGAAVGRSVARASIIEERRSQIIDITPYLDGSPS